MKSLSGPDELESNFQNGISQQRMIVIIMQSYIFVFVTFNVNTHPVLWKQELQNCLKNNFVLSIFCTGQS